MNEQVLGPHLPLETLQRQLPLSAYIENAILKIHYKKKIHYNVINLGH